jgi:phosphatidylserine decarboxylase
MQYLLPQHLLSALMYRLTRLRWRPLKNLVIRGFVRHFRVDMGESLEPDATAYETFNHFFTRELRPDARPFPAASDAVLCPADGTLSQLGKIAHGRVFQAKGRDYSLVELLGGRDDWAQAFQGGGFATIYLSPRDYHRVHMPLTGDLREMIHVPGRLFSVNPITTALVPRLFARNERLACLFESEAGPMAVILVGAIFVGSMETVWSGQVTPRASAGKSTGEGPTARLDRGSEMGRFNMGSTVILLFPPDRVAWDPSLAAGDPVRVRQRIGDLAGAGQGAA